jgi:hypothetical protein
MITHQWKVTMDRSKWENNSLIVVFWHVLHLSPGSHVFLLDFSYLKWIFIIFVCLYGTFSWELSPELESVADFMYWDKIFKQENLVLISTQEFKYMHMHI